MPWCPFSSRVAREKDHQICVRRWRRSSCSVFDQFYHPPWESGQTRWKLQQCHRWRSRFSSHSKCSVFHRVIVQLWSWSTPRHCRLQSETMRTNEGMREEGIVPDGSVRQKAATSSPEANLGRYCCFWTSVPNRRMPLKPIDWWAPTQIEMPRSCPLTISNRRAAWVLFKPRPPKSTGTWIPKAPCSFSPFITSSGIYRRGKQTIAPCSKEATE